MSLQATATRDRRETAAEVKRARERFMKARLAERSYARALRQIAAQVGHIINGILPGGEIAPEKEPYLYQVLARYAAAIEPWSRAVGARMIAEVARRDEMAWMSLAREVGRNLRREIEEAPTGRLTQLMLAEQVDLITSLPTKAAERVHELTLRGISEGTRASAISKMIASSGLVTKSRANLIARTEVARTASALTLARASAAGCTHYIWRTAGDSDVRHSHKEMEGQVIALDQAPTLSDGTVTHAGMIYNCRCYPEPILSSLEEAA